MQVYITVNGVSQEDAWEQYGMLLSMLKESDPRKAAEQFDSGYQHGGGWNPPACYKQFKVIKNEWLKYPGDEPIRPILIIRFREERIFVYEHDIVRIVQPDGSHEICRMD